MGIEDARSGMQMSDTTRLVNTVPERDNTFYSRQQLGEQSTVTVLVASAFCCCFLFLTAVAAASAGFFLLIWGAYILDNSE